MSDVYGLWGRGHPHMTHHFYLILKESSDPYTPPHNGPDHWTRPEADSQEIPSGLICARPLCRGLTSPSNSICTSFRNRQWIADMAWYQEEFRHVISFKWFRMEVAKSLFLSITHLSHQPLIHTHALSLSLSSFLPFHIDLTSSSSAEEEEEEEAEDG